MPPLTDFEVLRVKQLLARGEKSTGSMDIQWARKGAPNKLVASGSFFTADSGKRVVFDTDGVRLYNAGGTVVVNLDTATGSGTFAGALSAATGTFSGSLSAASGTFDGTLSATSGTLGTITAGNISGVTITGGTVRTASGARVEMAGSAAGELRFIETAGGNYAGLIGNGLNTLKVHASQVLTLQGTGITFQTSLGGTIPVTGIDELVSDVKATGGFLVGTTAGDPPTGYIRLYKLGTDLMGKASGKAAVVIAAL